MKVRDLKWVRENPEIATASEVLEVYDTITEGILFDRLEEICNAERDGRCVVLPCKVGDTIKLDTDGFMGMPLKDMPFTVKGLLLELFGDWGDLTQCRNISLTTAESALNKSEVSP